jgi:DNA-binding NarL/FixJ family response regulator
VTVVAAGQDGHEALRLVETLKPDILILDRDYTGASHLRLDSYKKLAQLLGQTAQIAFNRLKNGEMVAVIV